MQDWLFEPAPQTYLRIDADTRRFPVRRIICVGQNYAAHVREMGGDDSRADPFFFCKPADALVIDGDSVPYPTLTSDLHHEVELVVAVGEALTIVGCAVGVDLTRRDLQAQAKAAGRPWDAAKGFDRSAPCGRLRLGPSPVSGEIALSVNGDRRQGADLSNLIWSSDEILIQANRVWTLQPGDLIFTGTPQGVGRLCAGDRVEARIDGLPPLSFSVTP
ncbi:MAG: FAA hydrolase family protein [Caulobacteraceae bacterium]|nr:MAG: FAA hydrolase family protein [Caulobacteraceae bacterium]